MSTASPDPLHLTCVVGADSIRITPCGELDHSSAHLLLDAAARALGGHPDARELRLDCAGVTGIDALGLSNLLMLRRRTDAAGVRLYLENRSARLERLLELTGTLEHLTGTVAEGEPAEDGQAHPSQPRSARPDALR
ncbi:STAS domain-containing protein [Streptomyces sp. NPDC089919]|uniref:STAS domain-containing protein n=1 Tax=Streptomyces sp. NPDC089919 TaxID=3155188 RepID=UPI0034202551